MRKLVNGGSHEMPVPVAQFGDALYEALIKRKPIAPITDSFPAITIQSAYEIQAHFVKCRMVAENSSLIGRKIGATSKAVQRLLNIEQPDFGALLSTMNVVDGNEIDIDTLVAPRVEGEIAFLLKHDLRGPGLTAANVLRATEKVVPCIEIVDSRISDWRIRIQDTVADNASSGAFVLGKTGCDPRSLDLSLVGMVIEKNDEVVGTGAGAAALGHPLNSIAWLANTLSEFDIGLEAGEVVLSGALSGLVPVAAGDRIRVSIGGMGEVAIRFSGAPHAKL
jgi:2-oxopent-4-enoate/cis-2-oxohex-4-enoate hydratase